MSSKNDILNNVRRHINDKYDMPDLDNIAAIQYPDKLEKFMQMCKAVGGDARLLVPGEDVNEVIKSLYPEAKVIASNLPEVSIATVNPDNVDDPHDLNGTDLGIIKGELGVAENACVWVPQNVRQKVVYFISEYLVILLDKNEIVNNMHEAYNKLEFNDYGFGIFISGPSKTADIEQSLVVGAHGAKGVMVLLR
ncbi:LutC/YkgG family protein [Dysgonomonas macrotermitis]|uniref:L-lactate dehydrogenase complex protein LldG n=1 Tax=Dysgonomonas macrotermitis TaxID=1346286 RepID=A0A1M4SYV2_9BACT|nr:LUD domain-containing protein [Dysgonomonas macrotermitis]SHE37363.1 L-lactate dehydrogenase complex protein LldG [Dysgonomonas macrotermitis]